MSERYNVLRLTVRQFAEQAEKLADSNDHVDPGTIWWYHLEQTRRDLVLQAPNEVDTRGRPERIPQLYRWLTKVWNRDN